MTEKTKHEMPLRAAEDLASIGGQDLRENTPSGSIKHTPGPWTLDEAGLGVVLDATGQPVQTAGPDCPGDADGSSYANARLIAAAPELLAALRTLANEAAGFLESADVFTHGATNCAVLQERIDNARAVLAKVEGREHT